MYAGGISPPLGSRREIILPPSMLPQGWQPAGTRMPTVMFMPLRQVSGVVYAGGYFGTIGGKTRNNIAALNDSGVATSWNPNANDRCYGPRGERGGCLCRRILNQDQGPQREIILPPSMLPRDNEIGHHLLKPECRRSIFNALALGGVSGEIVLAGGNFGAWAENQGSPPLPSLGRIGRNSDSNGGQQRRQGRHRGPHEFSRTGTQLQPERVFTMGGTATNQYGLYRNHKPSHWVPRPRVLYLDLTLTPINETEV